MGRQAAGSPRPQTRQRRGGLDPDFGSVAVEEHGIVDDGLAVQITLLRNGVADIDPDP